MRRPRAPRGIRARLFLAVLLAVAGALAALTVGFDVLVSRTLGSDANRLLRDRAGAELAVLKPVDGRLTVGEAPDEDAGDTQVWVFSHGRALEAPRAGRRVQLAARSLAAASTTRYLEVSSADVRLYAEPVSVAGQRLGTVVAGISLKPYEQTRRTALIASAALALVLLLVVGLAARWLLRSALRPVVEMTAEAEAWSESDLERRFALGKPYDELTELAATLDGLLERLAASLRREQRFSAEVSHELRTPLAKIIGEAELALRRERQPAEYRAALELTLRNAFQLSRIVETLVSAARHEAGAGRGTADAHVAATGAVGACAGLAAERGIEFLVDDPSPPIRIGVDGDLVERILQPVVENACRFGTRTVRVSLTRSSGRILVRVDDDGPGLATDELERIFEPGVRGTSSREDTPGAGLGLALARRLARSAAGDVSAEANGAGGRFVVSLPAA